MIPESIYKNHNPTLLVGLAAIEYLLVFFIYIYLFFETAWGLSLSSSLPFFGLITYSIIGLVILNKFLHSVYYNKYLNIKDLQKSKKSHHHKFIITVVLSVTIYVLAFFIFAYIAQFFSLVGVTLYPAPALSLSLIEQIEVDVFGLIGGMMFFMTATVLLNIVILRSYIFHHISKSGDLSNKVIGPVV